MRQFEESHVTDAVESKAPHSDAGSVTAVFTQLQDTDSNLFPEQVVTETDLLSDMGRTEGRVSSLGAPYILLHLEGVVRMAVPGNGNRGP